ncbi:MAG: type II toxin-antitoxin system VapC family toxin [Treponema sp.]|nr:type II toxin-antitoxin system VapC family toxin [Candidatus Treponema equifaecale]
MNPVYLLDTNVVSEFTKPYPNENVIQSYEAYRTISAISSVTWQELVHGVERLPDGKRKSRLQNFIDGLQNNVPIIEYDAFAARICGEVQAKCENQGVSLGSYDSQIAATALANGMILVTHNTRDFEPFCQNSSLSMVDWAS